VRSISDKHKIYSQNSRVCNFLKTENFGDIVVIEVGAMLVGKINNYDIKKFIKGQEKGYFELGGSTIVVLTQNNIKIDDYIVSNSLKGIESKVKYGEKIGEKIC
jgi:phosphatidylserine decarboxylase